MSAARSGIFEFYVDFVHSVTRFIKNLLFQKLIFPLSPTKIGHPSLQMLVRDLILVATQYFRVNPAKRQAYFEVPAEIKHSFLHLLRCAPAFVSVASLTSV